MAYNVEQLINLQDQIGSEPIMPDSLDRYEAMRNIAQQGGLTSMLNEGGQPSIDAQVQNLASKGRYGDTMLMHVNPKEVAGLGGLTINPETGLPEAFWAALPFLAKVYYQIYSSPKVVILLLFVDLLLPFDLTYYTELDQLLLLMTDQ